MTLEQLLSKMKRDLEGVEVSTAALDARLLMRQGGGFSDSDLITKAMLPLSEEVIENTIKLLSRRLEGEPVSRIAGGREFYGRSFMITNDTLDPRPDTETLIDAALKRIHENTEKRPIRILDLGTGSGCILITLLAELPHATGIGIDLNPGAIAVSRENAVHHNVDKRVDFLCGSWFDPLESGESFDLIVSNPPYIPESDIATLAKEVREHDPFMALSGGIDGLDAYKIILGGMKKHLGCGGFALFEIGQNQEKDLARLVDDSNMSLRESYRDLGGIIRVLEIACGEK